MSYKGDIAVASTIRGKFTTRRDTGLPTTLAGALTGSPSGPELSIYKDGSTTQSTVGVTLTVDFDGITGLNQWAVDTSADAAFYTAGADFAVVITLGSVNSINVAGEVIGEFSIENRAALRPTVAGRTLDVTATGAAGIDWANVENPTTALNLSATNIDVDQIIASVSGAVGSVTGAVGSVTGLTASDVGAIKTVTDKLNTTMESTGSPTDYVFTARALAQAPSGTGASAIAIADEVQTRTIAGVTTVTNLTNAPTNGDLTAAMKTSVTTAASSSTPALSTAGNAAVADKILGRNLAAGSDGGRMVKDALRSLRNKTSISAGTLTVTEEDDTTPAWTAVVTTAAGDPLTSIDPA